MLVSVRLTLYRRGSCAARNFATIKAQDAFSSQGFNMTHSPLPMVGGEEASQPHKQAPGRV